jgi:N-dimethylarginine dimethylaminohydrolase
MQILMCAPEHFDVTYEINAWMQVQSKPNQALALEQWSALKKILSEDLGAEVELVKPQPGWPDMVFTANAGLVLDTVVIPSRFRFAERQGEVPFFNKWFTEHGYKLHWLPDEIRGSFEGEGDVLRYGEVYLGGCRMRTDALIYPSLSTILGKQVIPLELIDKRWYHLDTCFLPVRKDLLAYYPPAFDEHSCKVIENLPGEKIHIKEEEALKFGANAVVVGDNVVMNTGCPHLIEELEKRGLTVFATDLSEFLKSGGAAKCLTLIIQR